MPNNNPTIHDFGDGLVIRRAAASDTDALVHLQIHAFAHPDTGELDEPVGAWTRDLMSDSHPTFKPQDYLVVEDTNTGALVSCMCLISQTWRIEDISFGVGQVEIVCTDPAYRRRGLVREQFRVIHELSAERGELVQSIAGIPNYYRQFGYDYALEMPASGQTFVPQQVPKLKANETEKYRVRHAERGDIPFVSELYRRAGSRSLVSCDRSTAILEYEQFVDKDPKSPLASWWDIIETADGERVGILFRRRYVYQGRHGIVQYEILPPHAWDEVTASVLRQVVRQADTLEIVGNEPLSSLTWRLVSNHPLYASMAEYTAPKGFGYAWYLRVPDISAFLARIAPVLERRLAASALCEHTGGLRLNLYKSGVAIQFERGKLVSVEPWQATAGDFKQSGFGDAAIPDLTFLKMLFGYRSCAELQSMFPDFIPDNDKVTALLDVLFPKQASCLLPTY